MSDHFGIVPSGPFGSGTFQLMASLTRIQTAMEGLSATDGKLIELCDILSKRVVALEARVAQLEKEWGK